MKVHVFPFSRRDGTPAATMTDQIHPDVIRERVRILGNLERELALGFYRSRLSGFPDPHAVFGIEAGQGIPGMELEILAERLSDDRVGYVRGTDRWYMPVEIPGTIDDLGLFVKGFAVSANLDGVIAERISPAALPPRSRLAKRTTDGSELSQHHTEDRLVDSTDSEPDCCSAGDSLVQLELKSTPVIGGL